jgi:two-component system cell cycle sensor histidine kinase/response regulator CckA
MQTIAATPRCHNVLRWVDEGRDVMGEMGEVAYRILLVEDEFLISEMVAEVLAENGCEVHVAATAQEALKHLTCGAPCDVLFTDINLPGGVDGATLAQLARELRPNLPVVYASGLFTAIEQLNAVPGATFVCKPYDPNKVCALLQSFATSH